MLIEGTTLALPSGTEDLPDQVFDLKDILIAEGRQREVAIMTPFKAPELLYTFNKAWLDTDKVVKKIAADIVKAKEQVARRKAHILLYEVNDFLKSKGIDSVKETREAFIVLDEKYQVLQDRVDQLTAAHEWLKGKMESFTNSFTSVKKIMGEDTYDMSHRMNNPNLSGGGSQKPLLHDKQPTQTPTPTTSPSKTGYGKSRYDR